MLRPHSYQPPEDGLPPQEVRVLALLAESWPDQSRRVRITLELTPFLERPNLEVTLMDEEDYEVSSINIIESIDSRMIFTMHIRREESVGPYLLTAKIVYPEIGIVDQKDLRFEIKENNE